MQKLIQNELNIRAKTIKLIRKYGSKSSYIGFGNRFLDMTPKIGRNKNK